jgi:hypothetical protein
MAVALILGTAAALAQTNEPAKQSAPIPMDQLGTVAGQQYQGDALGITATADGARLRCGFQKLEGRATTEGLWLESTEPGAEGKLRLAAVAVDRNAMVGSSRCDDRTAQRAVPATMLPVNGVDSVPDFLDFSIFNLQPSTLPATGTVSVSDNLVRFTRLGLTEEYSVSVDGLRQDFVLAERPAGEGELRVELALVGARAEALAHGAKLTMEPSGRALAYNRLRASDATGRQLAARMEVLSTDRVAVCVADADAIYPVRIDPTFSDADWVSLNAGMPGANATVNAIVPDGQGNLYVGGAFTFIGDVPANCVAKWDGNSWSALGAGVNGEVRALALIGSNLYAGGNGIAKWDGNTWSALPAFDNNVVFRLAVIGTELYAGGLFNRAGDAPARNIAKWDGQVWSALGSGVDSVGALAVIGTDLYVGGSFTSVGGVPNTKFVAKWDGSSWSGLGAGVFGDYASGYLTALAVSGTDLYAAGMLPKAGGVAAIRIAKWDGSTWSTVGPGLFGPSDQSPYQSIDALAVCGTNLYAGGPFTRAVGAVADYLAKWDGKTWSPLGSGLGSCISSTVSPPLSVRALAVDGTNLLVGGAFTSAGAKPASCLAKWDGDDWSGFGGSGMNGRVYALAVTESNLYAGGMFTTAGNAVANCIAKWDGSAWSALGSGVSGYPNTSGPPYAPCVYALALNGKDLYVGGQFANAGGVPYTSGIAKWDGNAWSALGTGVNNAYQTTVKALAVSGSTLYAGGYFTSAGGVAANSIAKWNGSSWSALGAGLRWTTGGTGNVLALALIGANLYAAGEFDTAGVMPASNIAKWNGYSWSALGSGLGYYTVYALAVSGTDLYAGGSFYSAGGVAANRIAKWNGSAWSALGTGMSGEYENVNALAIIGTNLYAGGRFAEAGGVPANGVVKWDGKNWSALGWGIGVTEENIYSLPNVSALAADGSGHLFVGGQFFYAGSTLSPYVVEANLSGISACGRIERIGLDGASVTLDCCGVWGCGYHIQRASDVRFTQNVTTLCTTNPPPCGRFQIVDPNPPGTMAFYRLLKP